MTQLLDLTLPRTLDALVARFSDPAWSGARLEAWLFEDEAPRRAAEAMLAKAGVAGRIRSSYKPLLHAFLEETVPPGPIQLPGTSPSRFALEAYPLAALLPSPPQWHTGPFAFDHVLSDGTRVFAPNRLVTDPSGNPTHAACGWLRVWQDDSPILDEALLTEYEQAFAAVLGAVRAHRWPEDPPYFQTLHIQIATAGICRHLELGHECIDLAEALHEDLYFGLLELFKARAAHPPGDRRFRPGQIVPEIHRTNGPTTVSVRLTDRLPDAAPSGAVLLPTAEHAPDLTQIESELAALPGDIFTANSVQGRSVHGLFRPGSIGMVVSAGQHANETSGVVGLLRAAPELLADPRLSLALIPVENPDGYALHRRLCATHPHHMHHAARYTALGDDLEARDNPPFHETEARRQAIARTRAVLHLSLHGYPAHEWTRPLSGYIPAGFEQWTLPCGFFLILRHHPGLEAMAHRFLEALTGVLAANKTMVAMNCTQLALRRAHGVPDDTMILNDIPCRISESTRSSVPFTLITEYPDETITGPAFIEAHTVQNDTILAAAALLLQGALQATA